MDLTKKIWSYSSLKLFEQCPYAFKLRYIDEEDDKQNAFAQHGKFVHSLYEMWAKGELYAYELADIFEADYDLWVTKHFPFYTMYKSFFEKTRIGLAEFDGFDGEILGIEEELRTEIGGHKFIGYADLIMRDEKGIIIVDHKSHGKFKSKKERADYLRQLYLYAKPVYEKYDEYPYKLVFNVFRNPEKPLDEELFKMDDYNSAIDWFSTSVDAILNTTDWDCKVDKFYCENLCGLTDCVYNGGI